MWRILALCVFVLGGMPAAAQDQQLPVPIVTLNQDRLYANSLFGQRVRRELEEKSVVLAAENRRIEMALVAEEGRLTEERSTLDPEEFRALAEDFDERVTSIRKAQLDKRSALQVAADRERTRFFELAYPVLFEMANERGAFAILNQSAVILSSRAIDVTDIAIARIDAEIGASFQPPDTPAAPAPRPEAGAAPDADTVPPVGITPEVSTENGTSADTE